jgi:HEAT repeat protein
MLLTAILASMDDPDALIQQLGDDRIEVRDRAAAALRTFGEKAAPALRRATLSKDPEVKLRAEALLAKKPTAPAIVKIYHLNNVHAVQIAQFLQDAFQAADGIEVTPDLRTRSVVLRCRSAAQLALADTIVSEVDADLPGVHTMVVRTCASPESLARLLQDLLRQQPLAGP